MYKRIILISLVFVFLFCNPASATNLYTNGNFETGGLTGWTVVTNDGAISVGDYGYNSDYGARLSCTGATKFAYMYQDINYTDVEKLTFNYRVVSGGGSLVFKVGFQEEIGFEKNSVDGSYQYIEIDVSNDSGIKRTFFTVYDSNMVVYLDNVIADAAPPPTDYITWSTHPEDSWAVDNYSMIIVGIPRPPDPVDFYIKTPSTDYIKKPLTKSSLDKTWNYGESQWYYQYLHVVYHTQYGDYSCKIVNSSADFIEYSNITVPYSSPDIPIPPVVTIPTLDPIETPPEWNVTIPEEYENVSWIFDYTDFWDDLGITLNDTLYSTVGLLFIPMESINGSVYTVYTHVNTAADMVSGSEHTNVIVQVAWDVIPDSIKTVFVGAAAIGLSIFILHRRT